MTNKPGQRIETSKIKNSDRGELLTFRFDDKDVTAYAGESIAAALIAAGITSTRRSPTDMPRGYFCGMGVCWECLVTVNGVHNQRACTRAIEPGMVVQSSTAVKKP